MRPFSQTPPKTKIELVRHRSVALFSKSLGNIAVTVNRKGLFTAFIGDETPQKYIDGSLVQNIGSTTWVALTIENRTLSFFLNGTLQGRITAATPTTRILSQFTFGDDSDGETPFIGGLRELRISDIIRYTDSYQINEGLFASDSSTIALYHLRSNLRNTGQIASQDAVLPDSFGK